MTGKGDTPRPLSVPPETFSHNWDQTFAVTEPVTEPASDEAITFVDRQMDVIKAPITLRRPLDTLGDPEE